MVRTLMLVAACAVLATTAGCMKCPAGQFSSNFECRKHDCPGETSPDMLADGSIECRCRPGEQWVGGKCISVCGTGQAWGAASGCCQAMSGDNIDINSCSYTPPPEHNLAVGPHRM